MEVEHVNLVEGFEQAFAHPPVGEAVEIDVVGDEADDALAGPFDAPLRPAKEFDEVVIQIDFLFLEAAFVIVEQAEDEIVAVLAAKVGVRRVAEDDEDGAVTFDGGGFVGFLGQSGERPGLVGDVFDAFQGVGEVDVDALAGAELIGPGGAPEFRQMASAQFEADLEVRHGIRGHEQFKTEKARQQMFVDIGGPESGLVFFLEALTDLFDDFEQKRAGAGGRIEDEHTVRFLFDFLLAFRAGEREFRFCRRGRP